MVDPASYENIIGLHYLHFMKSRLNVPIIVVGTKRDLINDVDTLQRLRERNMSPLTYADGVKLAEEVKAIKYMECSSLTNEGVNEIFEEAARAAITHKENVKKQKSLPM